jgi:cation diffusion facilitator family transporter
VQHCINEGKTMPNCDCHSEQANTKVERRVIGIALALNATMFLFEATAGWIAGSSALLADALDMLADAVGYAIALTAIGRTEAFKTRAPLRSGLLLAILGVTVILEAVCQAIMGSAPEGALMLPVALLALIVNSAVLVKLVRYRRGEVHLRASWIFTRADVIANLAVILAALLVKITQSRMPDIVIGLAIGVYVVREAIEIRTMASKSRAYTSLA